MRLGIDAGYIRATLAELVSTSSVNPSLVRGAPGEAEIAARVVERMQALNLDVRRLEPVPGRVSVIGRRRGAGSGPSLMLHAHLDTVGVGDMPAPFDPVVREGKMFGRGAFDMKAGLAASLGAVKALHCAGTRLAGDLLVAAVADEEYASVGTIDLLDQVRTDAAIVTEPTQLQVCIAHKGFVWLEVETRGRAAHGSRVDLGIDANMKMGAFLVRLARLEETLRAGDSHPLLGTASLHAATLRGGTELSAYASRCRLGIERRTLPGEDPEEAVAAIRGLLRDAERSDKQFKARLNTLLVREAFQVRPDCRIVQVVGSAAARACGEVPRQVGDHPWMDAALLSAAGVETVVIGPSGGGAHADREWVELESVNRLARILADSAREYCGTV